MVRFYLPPRFSKRRMGIKIAERTLDLFRGPAFFRNTKVVHSTSCYIGKNGQLFTINLQAGAPYCPQDFWVLQFLRTYSDCIVTTGKILRKEPDAFDPSMIKSQGFDPKIYFEKPKPVAILSNSVNENLMQMGNRVYSDLKYQKHLLTKPAMAKRLLEHNSSITEEFSKYSASLDPVEGLNLRKAIQHLQSEYNYEMILLEAGASTTIPCYSETHSVNSRKTPAIDYLCDGNPIDTLYLGIFEGEMPLSVTDEATGEEITSPIGQPFCNMDWLLSQYNLIHTGEEPVKDVYNFKGVCRQTFWRKKSAKELAKLREKTLGLIIAGQEPNQQEYQQKKNYETQQQYDQYTRQAKQSYQGSGSDPNNEHASRSPHFDRRKYPYLSDKIFANKKPKV